MKQTFTSLLAAALVAAGLSATAQVAKTPKVLFIGIDGVRSDALNQAATPTMDSLMNAGLYTFDSWHLGITSSGPSWSTMMTGVWEGKHKVTNNNYTNADYNNYPYFPKRAKECRPNLKSVQIITWDQMNDPTNSNNSAGYVYNSGFNQSIDAGTHGQGAVTAAAVIQLADPNLDVLFIHYDETDATGHGSGFNPNNAAYMNAIQGRDAEIKTVLNALKARPTLANEDWLIMLTTDHGGIGTSHGGNANTERQIWWMAAGSNIPHLQITGPDPGSYQMPSNPVNANTVKNTPVLTDIAVTALAHLVKGTACGAPQTNTAWNLDGKSWLPAGTTAVEDVQGAAIEFGVFPNPSQGKFQLAFRDVVGALDIQVLDVTGRIMTSHSVKGGAGLTTVPFDLTGFAKGLYNLRVVKDGSVQTTRRVVLQ